jgi:ParB family chromosome partitioning protein
MHLRGYVRCDERGKKSELDHLTLRNDVLSKYFPKSYTPQKMQETIIKLLEQWQKKRQRDNVR